MSRALARKSFVSAESACGFVTLLCFNVHEAEDLARYRRSHDEMRLEERV